MDIFVSHNPPIHKTYMPTHFFQYYDNNEQFHTGSLYVVENVGILPTNNKSPIPFAQVLCSIYQCSNTKTRFLRSIRQSRFFFYRHRLHSHIGVNLYNYSPNKMCIYHYLVVLLAHVVRVQYLSKTCLFLTLRPQYHL